MIWPCVGVVAPRKSVIITVVIVEDERIDMVRSFEKLGPPAQFRQRDKLIIEWCEITTAYMSKLVGDDNEDFETLLSMWNAAATENWKTCTQSLRVRLSLDDIELDCDSIRSTPLLQNISMDSTVEDSIDTCTTKSVTKSLSSHSCDNPLAAEVENLRRRVEELTAERYILENQLEQSQAELCEARATSSRVIHKYQLRQTLICGRCFLPFSSKIASDSSPISSQACGHSVCRKCLTQQQQGSHSISSVFSCQPPTYSGVCPICYAPKAFLEHNVNESLCSVLSLMEK